jgi:hypothetical protein
VTTYDPTNNVVPLRTAPRTDPDLTVQLELFPAGDSQQPGYFVHAPARWDLLPMAA